MRAPFATCTAALSGALVLAMAGTAAGAGPDSPVAASGPAPARPATVPAGPGPAVHTTPPVASATITPAAVPQAAETVRPRR